MSTPTVRSAMLQLARLAAVSGILLGAFGSSARAQCPAVSLQDAKEGAALIISGVPTKMEPFTFVDPPVGGQVVTFAVDAVWKGAAGKTIALYQWSGVSESIRLTPGTRYVIFAGPIRSIGRKIQAPPTELQLDDCPCMTFEQAEGRGWIHDLGSSHSPQ